MAPYKLAFVIERYFEFGGLQRDMRRMAGACAKEGHDVTAFTRRWEGPAEPEVKVETTDFQAWTNHGTIRKMETLARRLKQQNRFDCVVGFHRMEGLDIYYGGDVCLKAKLQERGRWRLRHLPRYRTYLKQEAAVFGPGSDTEVMLISPVEAEKIQQLYEIPTDRVHILPPGIDRNRLTANPLSDDEKDPFRKSLGARDRDFIILTVGSSFHTKGIDRGIAAIAALPDELKRRCLYIIVGQGDIKKYEAMARKAGIGDRIYFKGGQKDIVSFYTAADILLHPARTENTGTVLLEAMVCGVPVIATEHCGYARYIQEAGAGAVCPEPYEQRCLNDILQNILADDEARLLHGRQGYDYCLKADIYSMIDTAKDIILRRAKKNRGPR
jgi:UDP-glucose:(heptosyl)LPS alpha-1,3-glucosyltransferase